MGYPIVLCEDDLIQLRKLESIVENYILFRNELLKIDFKSQHPMEVEKYLIDNKPQSGIYFLNLVFGDTTKGIQLAEKIRKYDVLGKIIFITTHDELASLILKKKIEPLGFILKDQNYDLFRSEIMNLLELAQQRIDALKFARQTAFTFSVGNETYTIDISEILFLETSVIPHRVVLYTKQGQYEFYSQLNELENKHPELFRVNRGCLVNLKNVVKIDFSKRQIVFRENLSRFFSVRSSRKIKKFMNNKK